MLPTLLVLMALAFTPVNITPGSPVMPIASRTMSLETRYAVPSVNTVFKDNILLTLSYMRGSVKNRGEIAWDEVEKPFTYEFELKPGEEFAFHDQIAAKYDGNVVKTTNAHFNYSDGFKSDGYLMGDGVCHLASLINWAARDAGLTSIAPHNHDFAVIPEVPKEYGVGIYALPGAVEASGQSNLYITNSKENPVKFIFDYKDGALTVSVVELK